MVPNSLFLWNSLNMENKQIESKTGKSTLLLVLFVVILYNSVQICRTGINTLFFTEDVSGDYTSVEATVVAFKSVGEDRITKRPRSVPVFSFSYQEEEVQVEAKGFIFDTKNLSNQPYQKGKTYTLWVHKRWGTLMVPPIMEPESLGKSQLKISAVLFFLAIGVLVLRSKLAKRK